MVYMLGMYSVFIKFLPRSVNIWMLRWNTWLNMTLVGLFHIAGHLHVNWCLKVITHLGSVLTLDRWTGSQDQTPFHCLAWRTVWTRLVRLSMSASLIYWKAISRFPFRRAQEVAMFIFPSGMYSYKVMLFGFPGNCSTALSADCQEAFDGSCKLCGCRSWADANRWRGW